MGKLKVYADGDVRKLGCGTTVGTDLVPNGDFETNVSGWAADDLVGGPSTFARSTAWSSSGSASFEATGFGGNGSWFKSTAYIPVTPSADYDLAAVFKRIGGTAISGWHFGLAFYTDTAGTHVSGPQYEWDTPGGSISDGPIGGTLTAPADAAYARIFFRAIGTAALYYIDDITLVRTSVPGRLKLYADGRIWREACDDDAGPTFTDDFNRTASATTVSNAAWTTWTSHTGFEALYTWGIRSGSAYGDGPSFGTDNILFYDVGTTDYDFTVTYTGASGKDPWVGLVFSMAIASGGTYRLWTNNGIGGRDAGTGTGMIQTGFPSIVAGDVLRIVCVGLSIELFLNGVSVSTITNTWETSGAATRVGLFATIGDMGGQWDDVSIIAGLEKHPIEINLPGGVTAAVCMTPA